MLFRQSLLPLLADAQFWIDENAANRGAEDKNHSVVFVRLQALFLFQDVNVGRTTYNRDLLQLFVPVALQSQLVSFSRFYELRRDKIGKK
jgi:hypothetical protein